MLSVGIRELRQQASRYLREVRGGETVEITDRGEPVAWMVPVPRNGALEELAASGRLTPADGDALDLGPPLEPVEGRVLPSEALAAARADER